ncbi:hypothetical protein PHMEG_00031924 [Phytophthora megakarya]|uniref:Uncharacterized protein n=1 Tax=Phytophthora megakarya TaxID=4795 RepID=A0A225UXH6_9STRA|nr:hypothetical protein PHMEG_00031924 [Phytophthora megakarya]
MLRWRLEIENFGPELDYVKGENNVVANTLSRLPRADNTSVHCARELATLSNADLREIAHSQKSARKR